jgi:DNA-binding CsgD family transcriptional regulator
MKFLDTNMPLVIFFIITIEITILLTQIIQYLSRTSEKSRLYHIYLIVLLVLYNIFEGFFPDDRVLWIPDKLQDFLGYGFGYVFATYCPIYFYKAMELDTLKSHGRFGYLFVMIPTVLFYGVLYPVQGDLSFTRKYVYIVPAVYAIALFYKTIVNINKDYQKTLNRNLKIERLCYFFAVFPVSITPIFGAWLGFPKWLITTLFNVGFLIVNWILMRRLILKSRSEHNKLVELTYQSQNSKLTSKELFHQNCRLYHLTDREIQIVELLVNGYKYKEVAIELFISERTVAKHVQHLYSKTGAKSKLDLVKVLNK